MSESEPGPEPEEELVGLPTVEAEIGRILGLFDVPAFARRGQDVEHAVKAIDGRCGGARSERLDMVRLRLRQWASAATGPDDWRDTFSGSIAGLWPLSAADPPTWADRPAPVRRRRAIAGDLVASVERFNRRWSGFVEDLNLDPLNRQIERYNRYYLLEKECFFGSHRLASRAFTPMPTLTGADLLRRHPLLPVPRLRP